MGSENRQDQKNTWKSNTLKVLRPDLHGVRQRIRLKLEMTGKHLFVANALEEGPMALFI